MNLFTRFTLWLKRLRGTPERERPPEESRGLLGRLRWPRPQAGDCTLRTSEIIYAAVSRISNALATMPVQLYLGTEQVRDPLNDLLRCSPNPNMSSFTFFRSLEASRDTAGNGYALKVLDEDWRVKRLDILDPDRVTPMLDNQSGELWYRIQTESGKTVYLHNWYIIHVQFVSTTGIAGISPIDVLRDTLDYDRRIQAFSVQQLEKGVNASVILEAPASLGPAQRAQTIKDFVETYRETGGNILLLESGVTAKALTMSPVDPKISDINRITRANVATVYNIPPHMLGGLTDTPMSSAASTEQLLLEFMSLTMMPIVTMYEQELDRKLLTADQRRAGFRWRFDVDAILRADAKSQAEVDQKAIRSAWLTPNEVRTRRGLPPDPDGGELMCSRDLMRLALLRQETLETQAARSLEGTAGE